VDLCSYDLTAISVCTGSGALDLALELAIPAFRPILYVEGEAFAAATLVQAIEAGYLAPAPLWADLRALRGRRFRGSVDFVLGGIPCQPHSEAGPARGATDARDLWPETRRLIVQTGAWGVFLENVGGILHTGGAYRIFRGLRRLGFKVEGGLFTAAEVGGTHERERFFILAVHDALADPHGAGSPERLRQQRQLRPQQAAPERGSGFMGDAAGVGRGQGRPQSALWPGQSPPIRASGPVGDADRGGYRGRAFEPIRAARWRIVDPRAGPCAPFPPGPGDIDGWTAALAAWPHLEPVVRGRAHELATRLDRARQWGPFARANRLDRLRLLGAGVVPLEAAYAFRALAASLARTSPAAVELVRMMADQSVPYVGSATQTTNKRHNTKYTLQASKNESCGHIIPRE
jgi:DNA (cytosine-5)-methyltransferase 1